MNNEQTLLDLIASINDDKSLSQPWKNYALSDLRRSLALLKMANGTIHQNRFDGPPAASSDVVCTCRPGMVDKLCAVHGEAK